MKIKHFVVIFLLVGILAIVSACSAAATTTSSCAFVVGDGIGGYDADLHHVIYPGQQVTLGEHEKVSYVPCNSRNFIVNDGTKINANGSRIGDQFVLIKATTNTGVPINIAARALWTLNQSEPAMRAFYTVCQKYQCASSQDQGGDVNFSTPGWNGMLSENMGPALEASAREAAFLTNDDIWKLQDPAQYQALADQMSAVFADKIRANLGFTDDLFCGSGNSTWSDPANPGQGTFYCSPVRIQVDEVSRGIVEADESTQGATDINRQRLENAQAIYGDNASWWLGLQDTIDRCIAAGTTCIFNIGLDNPPTMILPTNDPTIVPTTTP